MKEEIFIRDYQDKDAQALANIFYDTVHQINIQDYTKEQVNVWAEPSSLDGERFAKTKPLVAVIGNKVVGFAELERNGHIDCFYCHHEWIGKGVGSALMNEIFHRAEQGHMDRLFAEVSITAKPFFEKQGFQTLEKQTVVRKGIKLTNFKMEKRRKG